MDSSELESKDSVESMVEEAVNSLGSYKKRPADLAMIISILCKGVMKTYRKEKPFKDFQKNSTRSDNFLTKICRLVRKFVLMLAQDKSIVPTAEFKSQ